MCAIRPLMLQWTYDAWKSPTGSWIVMLESSGYQHFSPHFFLWPDFPTQRKLTECRDVEPVGRFWWSVEYDSPPGGYFKWLKRPILEPQTVLQYRQWYEVQEVGYTVRERPFGGKSPFVAAACLRLQLGEPLHGVEPLHINGFSMLFCYGKHVLGVCNTWPVHLIWCSVLVLVILLLSAFKIFHRHLWW